MKRIPWSWLWCLLLCSCAIHPDAADQRVTPDATAYRQVVDQLADPAMQGRGLRTDGLVAARDRVAQWFAEAGLAPGWGAGPTPGYLQPFEIDQDGQTHTVHNVIGVVRGQGGLAHQAVVIGAHYDHLGFGARGSHDPNGEGRLHPGANDNASGIAAMLRVAQDLAAAAQDQPPAPRRTAVFVAFTAEEFGLHGSHNFLLHRRQIHPPGCDITAMINLDMVGALRGGLVNIFGVGSGDRWRPHLLHAKRAADLDFNTFADAGGLSDHHSFLSESIPSVLLITQLEDTYHTPQDTADRVDVEGGVRVAAFAAQLLQSLLHDPQPMRFTGSNL